MKPKFNLHLYLVTDAPEKCRLPILDVVKAAIDGGVTIVQYRSTNPNAGLCYKEALPIAEVCKKAGVTFVVNNRLDLALALDADGAHIGQRDLPVPLARKILGPDKILGLSCSNIDQLHAVDPTLVDYLGMGPVFPTVSKMDAPPVLGIPAFAKLASQAPVPVVAIGGITPPTAKEIRATGVVAGIAVVSAICGAEDPTAVAKALM